MRAFQLRIAFLLSLLALLVSPTLLPADEAAVAEPPAQTAVAEPLDAEQQPAEQPAGDAESSDTDASDDEKFVRVSRDDDGNPLSLDTAVVSYIAAMGVNNGLRVDLVGAVHVGEKSYYEDLNELFEEYDVVLYELVAPEGTRIEKGTKADSRHPLGMMQGGMKDMLKLEHQLEQVDYTKENFVHADMSPEEFAKSMKDRGESFLGMFFRAMGQSMAAQSQQKNQISDADILIALFSKNRDLKLKRLMAQQFEDLETAMTAISGPDGSTIIEERNNKAFEVLKEQIDAGKKKIAVFYGAGHLPDMHEKLEADFELQRERVRWLQAWKLTR